MNITEKTQTQTDLDNLEKRVQKATQALTYCASQLNNAYDSVWNLPDDRLQALLQSMVDSGKFQEVFGVHAKAAAYINELLLDAGSSEIAKENAGREYTIENGVVTVAPLPEPEVIELEPEPEVNSEV